MTGGLIRFGGVSNRSAVAGSGLLLGAALVGTAIAWPDLSREIIGRWDASGSPDGTAARPIATFLIAALPTVYSYYLYAKLGRPDDRPRSP